MTSVFTTGGIRGGKKRVGAFHPRSFNMGISKEVYEATGGYIIPRMGEDIEFSIRIIEKGFNVGLIEKAYVFHKRRTSFLQFFKQLHFFGRARINIYRFFTAELKLVHFFPACFTLFLLFSLATVLFSETLFAICSTMLLVYFSLVFIHALLTTKSIKVSFLSLIAVLIMLSAYGIGFIKELFVELTGDRNSRK